jgi:hypothetical protein
LIRRDIVVYCDPTRKRLKFAAAKKEEARRRVGTEGVAVRYAGDSYLLLAISKPAAGSQLAITDSSID